MDDVLKNLDGLAELRNSCPPGTSLAGPLSSDGSLLTVNGRLTANCIRPDGTPQGPSITWHANGSRAFAGEHREGLKEGEWLFWHENGQLSGRGSFRRGKPEGSWRTWHDNGQTESEGSYQFGLHEGRFTHWDQAGQIEQVLEYDHGNLVKRNIYRDGTAVE